jgi:hypothetical protein
VIGALLLICVLCVFVLNVDAESLLTIHGEVKTHYRWSTTSSFQPRFPFPPEFIPRGQTAVLMRTVSPGSSFELSVASVILDFRPTESVFGRVRVNFNELYNRNPTSTDQTVNVKEAWLMFGRRAEFLQSGAGSPIYVLFGKAPKFERQPERNIESYGLVSTAFNRFEDFQLQLGGSYGPHLYWRAQVSGGNPVFFRDPNALAGDNGNDDLRLPNPEPNRNSGFPLLYDAEVEDFSFQSDPEVGVGAGARLTNDSMDTGFDVLAFYYRRQLASTVDLRGTFYGGDLDLLDGAFGASLPIDGNDKEEYGLNAEFHRRGLRLFFQGIHQEMAGLGRHGYEVEAAWRFLLPVVFAASGKQLFTFVQPVVRFSMLDNDFTNPLFLAPSTFWDWKKYDFGVRAGIIQGVDLTIEYSTHDIDSATPVDEDELLTTLRFRF